MRLPIKGIPLFNRLDTLFLTCTISNACDQDHLHSEMVKYEEMNLLVPLWVFR